MRFPRRVGRGFGRFVLVLFLLGHAVAHVSGQVAPSNHSLPTAAPKTDEYTTIPLGFAQKSFPDAMIGVPYQSSVQVVGGSGVYTLNVTGDVPPGLIVETGPSTIAVGGVPSQPGAYELDIAVTDWDGATLNGSFTIQVSARVLGAVSLSPAIVTDTEPLVLADAESVFFPAVVTDRETITVTDAVAGLDAARVTDNETIIVTDSVAGLDAAEAPVAENIAVTDSYSVTVLTVPSITWATPAPIAYGTPLSATQLDASSPVLGAFVYTPAAGAVLAPGSQTLSVTLTPSNPALYATATKTVTLLVGPEITSQPVSQTVPFGSTATFSVTAAGAPTMTYVWQYLSGSTWKPFAAGTGYNTATLTTFATTAIYNGVQLRVVITDGNGLTVTSNTVTLTVSPAINAQPTSQTVPFGSPAAFSVTASGVPTLTYAWQYLSGATWKPFAAGTGYNTATLTTFATTAIYNGVQLRVVVTDGNSLTATSSTVTLTVSPAINAQPTSQTVPFGSTATFSVTASGVPTLTYAWQYLSGAAWKPFAAGTGYNTATLTTFATTAIYNGVQLRVVITDGNGLTVTSNTVTLTVSPAINAQPTSQTVPFGSPATFSVTASGVPTLTYAWQYLNGATWKPFAAGTGYNTATLTTFDTTAIYNGVQLRVVITDGNGLTVTSNTVTLTVSPAITAQPISQTVPFGSPASFSVTASGVPTLTYAWQYLSGAAWKPFAAGTGYNTAALTTFDTTAIYNGVQLRVVVTDGNGLTVISNTVTLTVSPAINAQPISQSVALGSTATFSVTASGVPTVTYAWQYLNGATWLPFAAGTGYNTATLTTFDTTTIYNGAQLRVVVTDGNSLTVTSNTVTLTVE